MATSREGRLKIADKRLLSVLRSHGVANDRILEQKISDAGPGDLRVDPHVLTDARVKLVQQGVIVQRPSRTMPWYHLASTSPDFVEKRLAELSTLQAAAQGVSALVGQSLEIAVLRALQAQTNLEYQGDFFDLDEHDDSSLYS